MGKNIYLNEGQFDSLLKKMLMNEGFHKTAKTRTFGDKIREYVIPAEKRLNAHGMTLFADDGAINELPDVADAIDAKQLSIKDFLSPETFSDNDAFQLVQQWLKNVQYRGENKYARVLADENKPILQQQADERERRKLNNLSDGEKAMRRNIAAKNDKYAKYFAQPDFTCDAFNYYNNWSDGDFPIEISGESNIVLLDKKLQPFFEKEPDYGQYMAIKEKCKELGLYAFDGVAVYTPIVGKPIKKAGGYSFSVNANGKKQIPMGWKEMFFFLRDNYNVGVLQVDTSEPPCFYIKVNPKR